MAKTVAVSFLRGVPTKYGGVYVSQFFFYVYLETGAGRPLAHAPTGICTCGMASLFHPGVRAPPGAFGPPLPVEEKEEAKKGLSRVWHVMKMLYQNEVTRFITIDNAEVPGGVTYFLSFSVYAPQEHRERHHIFCRSSCSH